MDPELKERLIECVRVRSFLYDCNDPNYKDTELKEASWEEIGREIGIPDGKAVKGDWKKIRDNFRDALKRQKGSRSGQTAVQIAQYKYYNQLSFLIPFMSNRAACNSMGMDIKDEQPDVAEMVGPREEPEVFVQEPPPKKAARADANVFDFLNVQMQAQAQAQTQGHGRKREERAEERDRKRAHLVLQDANHPLDHFFKTMCETTKLMPLRWQIYIKKEVFNIVSDAEEQILASSVATDLQTHQSSPSAASLSPASTM